jgi:SAM-dependent methyltransferase
MDLPWDYEKIIREYLNDDKSILDYDTGGGEFLLSLKHPFHKTAATEGYQPNVELCKEILMPLGIDFKTCDNPADIPFQDGSFDLIINRHGDFNAKEIYRLLKKGGVFITEQVGGDNDRDLVEMVLPDSVRVLSTNCFALNEKMVNFTYAPGLICGIITKKEVFLWKN